MTYLKVEFKCWKMAFITYILIISTSLQEKRLPFLALVTVLYFVVFCMISILLNVMQYDSSKKARS